MSNFTHLHVHSHYSLLDGLPKIDELLEHVKENGMDAVALTDHGVMYGLVGFYQKAKAKDIKPILGVEGYVAPNGMHKKRAKVDKKNYHLTLLAKNNTGYKNLMKLISKAHLEGFYYKPRFDLDLLEEYAQGIICLSGCVQGEVPQLILSGNRNRALKQAQRYADIFKKGDYYIEIQPHHPEKVQKGLKKIAKKLNLPIVGTKDSHYLKKEGAKVQDILMAISTGATLEDKDRLTVEDYDLSLSGPEKMKEYFSDIPQAIKNTQEIKEKCNVKLDFDTIHLPKYEVPKGETSYSHLKKLVQKGARQRYGTRKDFQKENSEFRQKVKDRLKMELRVIKETGYSSYFLIVQDFVNWAKDNDIVVGPGRGSAAGSLVSYFLNITNVDPLKHDLIFERFLNPERISMPDIDIDFADDRRDEVIEYSRQKYGKDHVAQIITFGKMAARMAVRDVGRSLGYSYDYCDRIAKMIPFGDTIDEALTETPELKQEYDSTDKAKKLLDFSKQLEGVARHASTHACGVVITRDPLTEYVPLQRASSEDKSIVTQYEMHAVEDMGLLKMDFLGLKNLTIIQRTLDIVRNTRDENIDIDEVPMDDKKTYKVFQKGATSGIFQFESRGMKRYLKQLEPSKFDDLVAMVALYRPGPMDLIPSYIKRKHGEEEIEYVHPDLEPILKETYGVAVYQEQLLEIARQLGGFSYGEADILRKAIGKKIQSLLEEQKNKLISGMVENGIEQDAAEQIWEFVEPFARYGFNRCLTGDTKIPSPTGKTRTVRELYEESKKSQAFRNTGKSVVALDENDLKLKRDKITNIEKNGGKKVYKIKTTAGRKIEASENHRFLTFEGWKKLKELQQEDKLKTTKAWPLKKEEEPATTWDKIENIEYAGKKETYDLTTEKHHNFVANGIITHNSHAASYATIAYQTAYLKAHYPVEFMASLLTADSGDVDKVAFLVNEARRMDIEVLPPDVNESLHDFTVSNLDPAEIRFGLSAVKNVGDNLINAIIEDRKKNNGYDSMQDFVERITHKDLNKKSMESLIKAGAFDKMEERGKLLANLETLLTASKEAAQKEENGQASLFEAQEVSHSITLSGAEPAEDEQKLAWEKKLLGLYISSHPLKKYAEKLEKKATHTVSEIDKDIRGKVRVGGIITEVNEIRTKNGKRMAFATLEDLTTAIELVVFPGTFNKKPSLWQEDEIVLLEAKPQKRENDENVKLLVQKAKKLDK